MPYLFSDQNLKRCCLACVGFAFFALSGCVPYRIKHLDFATAELASTTAPQVHLSLESTAQPGRSGDFAGPYILLVWLESPARLGAESRVDSLVLVGLADSVARRVVLPPLRESSDTAGVWYATELNLALPYQDYEVTGSVVLDVEGSISRYRVRGNLRRAQSTSWGFWPWDIILGA